MAFTLSTPCFSLLFFATVQLSIILTLFLFMTLPFGRMAQFLFLLVKMAAVSMPTALVVTVRPCLSIRHAQCAQVFLLKPVPFCKLFTGLSSTKGTSTSFPFSSQTLALSLLRFLLFHPSFISHSLAYLAKTICFLLYYQATMGPQSLISFGEWHDQ